MTAKIYAQDKLIGLVDLMPGDVSMGHIYGTFLPNAAYNEHIRHTVWRFNNDRARASWETLRLTAQLENGGFLEPAGGIDIWDVEELPDEPIQIDVVGVDAEVIERYFASR